MGYFLLGLSLVAGLILMGRWLLNAEPRDILRVAKWSAITFAGGVALFVLLRGRLEWLFYAIPFLVPFLLRNWGLMRSIRNAAKAARGPTPGQSTGVRTAWLAMTLDHDSGAMDGEVLRGPYTGWMLSDLDDNDLRSLAHDLQSDPESLQIFDAWIERMRPDLAGGGPEDGASSRQSTGGGPRKRDDAAMTRTVALDILGLKEGASESEIREAHRRLMMANHPDRGGSSWVAARINQAKDYLLGKG